MKVKTPFKAATTKISNTEAIELQRAQWDALSKKHA
jgi:hypothetical protein